MVQVSDDKHVYKTMSNEKINKNNTNNEQNDSDQLHLHTTPNTSNVEDFIKQQFTELFRHHL